MGKKNKVDKKLSVSSGAPVIPDVSKVLTVGQEVEIIDKSMFMDDKDKLPLVALLERSRTDSPQERVHFLLSMLERKNAEVECAKKVIDALKKEDIDKLKLEAEVSKNAADALTEQVKILELAYNESSNEIRNLKETILSKDEIHIDSLSSSNEEGFQDSETLKMELEKANRELLQIEEKHAATLALLEKCQTESEMAKEEASKFHLEEIEHLNESLKITRSEIETREVLNQDLQKELTQLKNKIVAFESDSSVEKSQLVYEKNEFEKKWQSVLDESKIARESASEKYSMVENDLKKAQKECEELKTMFERKVDALTSDVLNIRGEFNFVKHELESARKENKNLKNSLDMLQRQKETATRAGASFEERLRSLQGEHEKLRQQHSADNDLQIQLDKSLSDLSNLNVALSNSTDERNKIVESMKELNSKLEAADEQNNSLSEKLKEVVAAEKDVSEKYAKLQLDLKRKNESEKKSFKKHKNERKALEDKLKAKETELGVCKINLSNLETSLKSHEDECSIFSKRILDLESELETTKKLAESAVNLEDQLKTSSNKVETLESRIEIIQSSAELQQKRWEDDLTSTRKKLAESESLVLLEKENNKKMFGEAEEFKTSIEKLSAELESLKKADEARSNELEQVKAENIRLIPFERSAQYLIEQKENVEASLKANFEDRLQKLKEAEAKVNDKEDELKSSIELKTKVEELQETLVAERSKFEVVQKILEEERKKLELKGKEAISLSDDFEHHKKSAQAERKMIETELFASRQKLRDAEQRVDDLKNNVTLEARKLEVLSSNHEEEVKQYKTRMAEAQRTIDELEHSNKLTKESVQKSVQNQQPDKQLLDTLSDLQAELKSSLQKEVLFIKEKKVLEDEMASLKQQLDDYDSKCSNIRNLEAEKVKLESRIEEIQRGASNRQKRLEDEINTSRQQLAQSESLVDDLKIRNSKVGQLESKILQIQLINNEKVEKLETDLKESVDKLKAFQEERAAEKETISKLETTIKEKESVSFSMEERSRLVEDLETLRKQFDEAQNVARMKDLELVKVVQLETEVGKLRQALEKTKLRTSSASSIEILTPESTVVQVDARNLESIINVNPDEIVEPVPFELSIDWMHQTVRRMQYLRHSSPFPLYPFIRYIFAFYIIILHIILFW